VALPSIIWRELLTGLAIGAGLALVATPLMLWRWGAPGVAVVLALSLISTCTVASGVAIVLP
jgi:Mg/Co/Ni transporter MgtE